MLVDVTVVSGNGEPVEGLTAADFQLTINGQVRDVNTVQFISSRTTTSVSEPARLEDVSSNDRESTGRLLLFVVDENYLRVGAARTVLRAAERVMERLLPGDLVGLARLPTGRGGVEFTTDRSRIRRALSGTMGQQPPRPIERVRLSEAAAYERNDQNVWAQVIQRECGGSGVPGAGGGSFQMEACVHELEAQASHVLNDASTRTRVSINAFEDLTKRLATVNAPVNIVLISEGLFIGRDRNDLGNLARLAALARVSFFVVQPDESMFDMDTPKIVGNARDDSVMSEGLEQLAGYHARHVLQSGLGRRRRLRTDRPRAVGLLPALVRADRRRSRLPKPPHQGRGQAPRPDGARTLHLRARRGHECHRRNGGAGRADSEPAARAAAHPPACRCASRATRSSTPRTRECA